MNYPDYRPRRMRRTEALRRMVRETWLSVDDFVYPMFCVPGSGVEKAISYGPGGRQRITCAASRLRRAATRQPATSS